MSKRRKTEKKIENCYKTHACRNRRSRKVTDRDSTVCFYSSTQVMIKSLIKSASFLLKYNINLKNINI